MMTVVVLVDALTKRTPSSADWCSNRLSVEVKRRNTRSLAAVKGLRALRTPLNIYK